MTTTTVLRELLRILGVVSLTVVLFLVFAIFAIAIRPLIFIAVFLAAVVGMVLYCFSPRFREWVKAPDTERSS